MCYECHDEAPLLKLCDVCRKPHEIRFGILIEFKAGERGCVCSEKCIPDNAIKVVEYP